MSDNDTVGAVPPSSRVAVLGFHKIGAPPPGYSSTWFYISEEIFEGFLGWLRDNSWQVIDAETFVRGLDAPETLPQRAALLTFDDGYRSMRHIALPLLRSFGLASVLFVPVGYIGSTNRFDADVEPQEPICDWEDLEAMQRDGVSIQSHGFAHRRWSTLDDDERKYELQHSKKLLEEQVCQPVRMFSFPYGDNGDDAQTAAGVLRAAGYSAAFLYGGSVVTMPCPDRFAVQRIPMGPDTDLAALLA